MGYTATYPRPEKTHPTAKNRVWEFFAEPNKTRPANRLQPAEPRREIDPTTTKTVSGVFFYGYRYYDPVTGRWPSRDPLGERGALNLYGFIGNDAVNYLDLLGLSAIGDAMDILNDPESWAADQIVDKLTEKVPAAEAVKIAHEIGKLVAEAVDAELANHEKKLKKAGLTLSQISELECCLWQELQVNSLADATYNDISICLGKMGNTNMNRKGFILDLNAFTRGVKEGLQDFLKGKIKGKLKSKIDAELDLIEIPLNQGGDASEDLFDYVGEQLIDQLGDAVDALNDE